MSLVKGRLRAVETLCLRRELWGEDDADRVALIARFIKGLESRSCRRLACNKFSFCDFYTLSLDGSSLVDSFVQWTKFRI